MSFVSLQDTWKLFKTALNRSSEKVHTRDQEIKPKRSLHNEMSRVKEGIKGNKASF